ncbi:MAG: globin [Bacteroidetes bacterium CG2_30_33_31]|nr:MAG: globin [Bacteroidetes bacterium CG2_30_33_31]
MKLNITPMPNGQLAKVEMTNPDFFRLLGEQGIRNLISDHYNLLKKSNISNLFPQDEIAFEQAKLHSSDFFIQVLGGHPYFNENRGNPMLRKRHQPFKITADARITWLECYQEILPKLKIPENLIISFWNYLDSFSMMMVNTAN